MTFLYFLYIDADNNSNTCLPLYPTLGCEIGITISGGESHVGDARDGTWSNQDFPGALQFASFENWLEASLPLLILTGIIEGNLSIIKLITNNDHSVITEYQIKPDPVLLLGTGIIGFASIRRQVM